MSEVLTPSLVAGGPLDRERSVAGPRFNRWLVPPAALAIHLCIGMAYGFSVFWLPMSKLLSGPEDASCKSQDLLTAMFSATCNWNVPLVTHTFEIFIAMLACPRRSGAVGSSTRVHARPASLPRCAGAAVWCLPVSVYRCISCGCSGWAQASSAAWVRGWATSARYPRSSNGSRTAAVWPPALPSWAMAAVR